MRECLAFSNAFLEITMENLYWKHFYVNPWKLKFNICNENFTRTLVRWVGCLVYNIGPPPAGKLIGYNQTALLRLIALYRNIL